MSLTAFLGTFIHAFGVLDASLSKNEWVILFNAYERKDAFVDGEDNSGIIEIGGGTMGVLPKADAVVIPNEVTL